MPTATQPTESLIALQHDFQAFQAKGLKLDLTRGKPATAQLDLADDLLALPGAGDFLADGAVDARNYGGIQGLMDIRRLFSNILGAEPQNIIVGGTSSLAVMHDTVVFCLLKGTCNSAAPWHGEDVAFLCPVPGYDRHFAILAEHGIRMIPVRMNDDGPDCDQVEELLAADPSIRGMWCVPKYANPTGAVYSDRVVQRLASMPAAAPDFRIFWDNAYAVHHLTEERIPITNILEACAAHGNPNRAFVFASTSKISLAGAGVSFFASSPANVAWMIDRLTPQTIGPDKVNQLRHVRFFRDEAGIHAHMDRHRALIAPKFQKVLDTFDQHLSGIPGVSWTRPLGGYFISLEVPAGCARRTIELARQAGITLTPAGSTHPHGQDSDDRTIRIAPTFPTLADVADAAEGVALCVRLAAAESSN